MLDNDILELINDPRSLEKGFRLLVEKYQQPLYWHIRRLVNNHHDADDVIQNVFVKVYKNIHKFQGNSKLYTWLYRIASNESITFINQRKKKATIGIDSEMNSLENSLVADEFFCSDQIQLQLVKAINTLPNKQKQVFNLRYYEEMPYRDISDVLGTSVGGLKASYHIAVKKIESFLKSGAL